MNAIEVRFKPGDLIEPKMSIAETYKLGRIIGCEITYDRERNEAKTVYRIYWIAERDAQKQFQFHDTRVIDEFYQRGPR